MRSRNCFILLILLGLLTAGCDQERLSQTPVQTGVGNIPAQFSTQSIDTPFIDTTIVTWIREHAIPIETVEPGQSFQDLMPLKKVIGDARIVALGEINHGIHENFTLKHRIIEFLVEEMQFNILAIEDSWSMSQQINDYLMTGKGKVADLLTAYPLDTEEFLTLIEWMRAENEQSGKAPLIQYLGFDMQDYGIARLDVIRFLKKVDPEQALWASRETTCVTWGDPSPECHKKAEKVYDLLLSHQTEFEKATSPDEFDTALHSALVILQALDRAAAELRGNELDRRIARDKYMAENIAWIFEQAGPEAKLVIWAHNGHVSKLDGWMGSY